VKGMELEVTGVETIEIQRPGRKLINLGNLGRHRGEQFTAKQILHICGYSPKTAFKDTQAWLLVEELPPARWSGKTIHPAIYRVK